MEYGGSLMSSESEGGLYQKYEVRKDGEPVEDCFVLEPEDDSTARRALETYANETEDEELAQDLRDWVTAIEGSLSMVTKQEYADEIHVTTHDGHPALEVGDMTIMLRMVVKAADQHGDYGEYFEQVVETRTETDHDPGMGSWWDVTRDDRDEDEYNPYPWVHVQPEVVEDA